MFRTEKQQKKLCASCPFAKTANIIGDSVVLLIIRDLFSGPKRFGDLEAALSGVSTRTLAEKLRMLEEEGLIVREEFIGKPPRVEYTLTKKGAGLKKVSDAMIAYGSKYI